MFELKNLIFSKKFLITLALLISAISTLFARNYLLQDYAFEQKDEEISSLIKFHRDKIYAYEGYLLENPGHKQTEELIKANEPSLQAALIWRSGFVKEGDWREILENETAYIESLDIYFEQEDEDEHPLSSAERSFRIQKNEEYLQRDIPPEYIDYSLAVPNFFKQVIDLFVKYGGFIIILILISELLAHEFETRKILFQFTQPIKRANIIIAKFFAAVIAYVITLAVILLTTYIIPTFFGHDGSFEYPIFININEQLQAINIAKYISNVIIVSIFFALVIISLYLLISLFMKQTLLTLFVVTIITVFGALIPLVTKVDIVTWINPFRYFLTTDFMYMQNISFWYQGIPASILLTILFLMFAMIHIRYIKVE